MWDKWKGKIKVQNLFVNPEQLLEMFDDYLEWIEANGKKEEVMYGSKGEVTQLNKLRAPSIQGFAFFLRTNTGVLKRYAESSEEYEEVFKYIHDAIYAITYEGAAAGLLKEAIVMRKLGMADKVVTESTQRRVVIMQPMQNGRVIDAPDGL